MLLIGLTMMLAAAGLAALATGLVTMPASGLQRRLQATAAPEQADTGRWARLRADVSDHGLLAKLTAPTLLRKIERNLVLAGRPDGWTLDRIIVAKPVGALLGLLFAVLVLSSSSSRLMILFSLGVIVLGYFAPDLLIYNRAVKRQEQI